MRFFQDRWGWTILVLALLVILITILAG